MTNYDKLRLHIQNYIKGNGNREITGFLLQDVLLSIVDTLGDDIIKISSTSCENARNSELLGGHPASYFAVATDFNNLASAFEDMFYITEDGESIGTRYNFFSEKEVSSNGLSIGGGGSGGGLISQVFGKSAFGTITTESNAATFNAYAIDSLYKRIVLLENKEVDLAGYATEAWVLAKNYITSAALSPYLKTADANSTFATLVALNALSGNVGTLEGDVSTLSSNLNALKGRFDALDDALNDDVSGKINTWNEIVDFLDEYNGSEDLATVLSGMNADIASRLKSSDFDAWKTDVYSPLAARVSTAEGNISTHTTQISGLTSRIGSAETNISTNAKGIADNKTAIATNKSNISANATAITNLGKRVTANEGNIAEILKWFAVDADGNLYTTYNLYSTKEISANGLSIGSGSSGGGLISQVYGTTAFGTIASESNSATFNAYAIDSLYKRIVSLEGKATAVSFVPALTSGKQIGTLSIDGVSTVLYGVDAYSKTDADSTFLKLTGGEVKGYVNFSHATQSIPLGVHSKSTDYVAIRFTGKNGNSAYLIYSGTEDKWEVSNVNWARTSVLLHSNNYSQYALPLTGGTITGGAGALEIKRNGPYLSNIKFSNTEGELGKLGFVWANNPAFFHTDGNYYPLYHTGNFNPADYLPLSGGTISGSGSGILTINRTSGTPLISFQANGTNVGFLGIDTVSRPCFVDPVYYETNYLIHSGNIGSQSVASANKLVTASGSNYAYHSDSSKYTVFGISGYNCYIDGVTTYFRYGANSAIGITLNSSGNTTIGSTGDLAGTSSKLYVNGHISCNGNLVAKSSAFAISAYNSNTNAGVNVLDFSSSNKQLWYGYGMNAEGYYTMIGGNVVALRYGASRNYGLYLNASGNVGIGTTSPEHKLHVAGSLGVGTSGSSDIILKRQGGYSYITATTHLMLSTGGEAIGYALGLNSDKSAYFYGAVTMSSTLSVANAVTIATNVQIPINGDRITFCSATGTYTKGVIAMNTSNTYLEAPLATDSASGTKPAILIGWRGCSAATGTTKPYPITITSGEIALNGTTAINGTLKNVNNIYPNSEGERYIGTSSNPFRYVYADWFGAATNSNLAFGANNGTHMVIKTSGNVLIGTTTDSGYKLDVNGDIATNQYLRIKAWSGFGSGSCDMWYNGSTTTLNMGSRLKLAYGLTIDSEGANIIGTITANSGVKVASGQALTFLDASGKEHKLTYDSTAGAFKFDGNILVLGDGQFNAIN